MSVGVKSENQAVAVRSGEELDLTRLEPFLRSHFPDESASIRVQQFPSGHSNLTYLVSLGERQLVFRRPPFGSKVKTPHDMGREFRVLSKLHDVYRSEEHTSELQSHLNLVCRLLLEKQTQY